MLLDLFSKSIYHKEIDTLQCGICLAIHPAASVGCITQTPPSQVCIQPPPCCVALPGPMLCASGEPVRVGGHTACLGTSSFGAGLGYGYSGCYSCY
uniref:Keratin n=1 Tax=Podarcis muralis TaxID=64176 RepID=A0A670JUE3_PODMU